MFVKRGRGCYNSPSMNALLLAAGYGTRLRPLTDHLPKPLVPICGTPLIQHTLLWMAAQGVTHAAVNLFHLPDAIPAALGSRFAGIALHYFPEPALRGTAGAALDAAQVLGDAPFFVIYGDGYINADLRSLLLFHKHNAAEATLALFRAPDPTAVGLVDTDDSGRVLRFVEKPPASEVFTDRANAGVYVLNPSVLNAVPHTAAPDFGHDVFPALLAQKRAVYAADLQGTIQDTGTPEGYRAANWQALARTPNPALHVGENVRMGANITLHGRNIVGRNCTVGDGAALSECILWDGANVPAGTVLQGAIVARGDV